MSISFNGAAALLAFAALAASGMASANPTVMQKAGQTSCSTCHDSASGQVPSLNTLNAAGQRYLNCKFDQSCYNSVSASLPPPGPSYQAPPGQNQPQYQAPPTGYQQPQYQPPPPGYQQPQYQ